MDASDQQHARPSPVAPLGSAPDEVLSFDAADSEPNKILPTMADLDRLAADLDRVDLTLVEIDAPAPHANN